MPPLQYQLQPAAYVLQCLGVRPLARKLGLTASTVSNWNRPPSTSDNTQSGTGGYIPVVYWRIIAEIAAEAGYGHAITLDWLASKPHPEYRRMTAPSKLKGDRFEREIVEALHKAGFNAQRVPLSGAAPGYPGDIYLHLPKRTVVCQCKISKHGEGYTMISKLMRQACYGRVDTDGGVFLAMHFSTFTEYLREHDNYGQKFCRVPVIYLKGKTITDAIEGHEVLFFRRDRGDTYVVVPITSIF